MGHFHKCGSLAHAGWLSLSGLMQLSACLSRKCFSERYDYSRLLSKFFCVSAFKKTPAVRVEGIKMEREGGDVVNSPGGAGVEVAPSLGRLLPGQ